MNDVKKSPQSYQIKLPFFEGPFDLLLFFIQRDELDIYDIPIASITQDFLDYIHQLEILNVEVASEFILVAAQLMTIKSKMLLPRPEIDNEGNEIDPREDLVNHLLEYKKYKSVLAQLSSWETTRLKQFSRGNVENEIKKIAKTREVESELQDLDLYKMMRTLEKLMKAHQESKQTIQHKIVQYPYTINQQKKFVLQKIAISEHSRFAFSSLFEENHNRIFIIFSFLAILELLQMSKIALQMGTGFNNFWLVAK